MSAPSAYERKQILRIQQWREQPPDLATRLLSRATGRAARVVQSLVPSAALRLALDSVQAAAERLSDERSVLRRAGATSLEALQAGPLQRCDRAVTSVRRRSMLMAGGSGALFGAAGGFGLVADVPSLLVIAFRSIHRVGLCYGEDCFAGGRRQLALAVFALASANSLDEKAEAFAVIDSDAAPDAAALRSGLERTARRQIAKETASLSVNRVARQVGTHLGWRKAAESLPLAGALVGGSVNAWYLSDVTHAAQYAFQSRWLTRRQAPAAGDNLAD